MPALDALQDRFAKAHTQPLGVSVDSIHCHANWARDLGGISFPLLADFHPKGAVASSFGLYLEDGGITDRATVIIDANGIVQHVSSVTPAGSRNIEELAALAEKVDADYEGTLGASPEPAGLATGTRLFVKSNCGFSRAVLVARANLHLEASIPVVNISEDAAAMAELEKLTGKQQAPALVVGDEALLESKAIIERLRIGATGF